MNVHKFSVKPTIFQPKTIYWRPASNLNHPPIKVNPLTWQIFSQKEITLTPRQVFPMQLGLGFMMTKGIILTSLAYSLRFKNYSLQNEISLEDIEDILITITNNSKDPVKIKENELLCSVYYHLLKYFAYKKWR